MKKTGPEPREEDKIPPPLTTEDKPAGVAADAEGTDDPVVSLQSDLDRFRDLALRTQADFENYKKRSARERDDAINMRTVPCSSGSCRLSIILSWGFPLPAMKGKIPPSFLA